jgi:hypothetical protein
MAACVFIEAILISLVYCLSFYFITFSPLVQVRILYKFHDNLQNL